MVGWLFQRNAIKYGLDFIEWCFVSCCVCGGAYVGVGVGADAEMLVRCLLDASVLRSVRA